MVSGSHMDYLGRLAGDRDSEEEHGHAHPSHHGKQQRVPGVPVARQTHLQQREGNRSGSWKDSCFILVVPNAIHTVWSDIRNVSQSGPFSEASWFSSVCPQSNCAKQDALSDK